MSPSFLHCICFDLYKVEWNHLSVKVGKVVKNTLDHFGRWDNTFSHRSDIDISRGSNEYVVPIGTFIGELDGGGISYLRRF